MGVGLGSERGRLRAAAPLPRRRAVPSWRRCAPPPPRRAAASLPAAGPRPPGSHASRKGGERGCGGAARGVGWGFATASGTRHPPACPPAAHPRVWGRRRVSAAQVDGAARGGSQEPRSLRRVAAQGGGRREPRGRGERWRRGPRREAWGGRGEGLGLGWGRGPAQAPRRLSTPPTATALCPRGGRLHLRPPSPSQRGSTASDCAKEEGYTEVVKLLENHTMAQAQASST